MKRCVQSNKKVDFVSNDEFRYWYSRLSRPEQDKVDDLVYHNTMDYSTASDIELGYIKNLYEQMKKDEEDAKTSDEILDEVKAWAANHRIKRFQKFEKYGIYLEKHSVEDMIKDYIRWFNQNIREGGNGFDSDWDSDDTMDILYKNGKIRTINPEFDEGTKRISVDGIDSIILNGGWGTAFAGPSITFEDYTVYCDIIDIRPEFTWGG